MSESARQEDSSAAGGLSAPQLTSRLTRSPSRSDGWANTSQSIAPWMPKEGFCDHSAVGGATEENLYCTADMGLTQADTTAITDAWKETMKAVQAAILSKGAFAWAYFDQQTLPAASDGPASCAAWFRGTGKQLRDRAFVLQYTNATERPLPAVAQDIAAFQVLRGPYAWIGYGERCFSRSVLAQAPASPIAAPLARCPPPPPLPYRLDWMHQ